MNHSKLYVSFSLLVAVLTLTAGCGPTEEPTQQPTVKPNLLTECIAAYYQQDSAPYITQQVHGFNAPARYLQIIANEPTGRYAFRWHQNDFTAATAPTSFLSGLPASFVNNNLSAALFYGFTAAAELLDTDSLKPLDKVKLEGQWYQALELTEAAGGLSITLYRNLDTTRIERLTLDAGSDQWLLEIYNFRYSRDLDNMAPRRIDVFDISRGLASKRRMIQFEYKTVVKQQALAAVD